MSHLSRREFAAMLVAGGAGSLAWDAHAKLALAATAPPLDMPKFDGTLHLDLPARTAIAIDNGNLYHRVPAAVLRPGSVRDVVRMIKYANEAGLKVAARGHAHSRYGQTQAEAGVVIDMNGIRAVSAPTADSIDAQPGAEWADVTRRALERGLVPPVLLTCMQLTVGGTLNAGGIGPTSHRDGAQLDMVTELDVVTGRGQLVTCSPSRESELFNMILGGQGQCGFIVRARIRLVRAPTHVALQNLTYRTADAYVAAQMRMATEGRFDHLDSLLDRDERGGWNFTMMVGKFQFAANEPDMSALTAGLGFDRATAAVRMPYADYLVRNVSRDAAALSGGRALWPTPNITMLVPATRSSEFMMSILESPLHRTGMTRYAFWPLSTGRLTRPLFRAPGEPQAFAFWLFRTAPTGDEKTLADILTSNRELLARLAVIGGHSYAPYTPERPVDAWREHFGPDVWRRLVAAKRKYDPNGVLSPNPAIFASR